jgi:hypothetical protein
MNLCRLQKELEVRVDSARGIPAERTALSSCAREFLVMIHAYHEDGITFLRDGDLPNALASFAYALGWLDAGSRLGLIGGESCGLPTMGNGNDPGDVDGNRLAEKTRKYHRLLEAAMQDLVPASEQGSCLCETEEKILMIARIGLAYGEYHERSGDTSSALAEYSYSFGWLDAGVRTGLFRIMNQRDLFTI